MVVLQSYEHRVAGSVEGSLLKLVRFVRILDHIVHMYIDEDTEVFYPPFCFKWTHRGYDVDVEVCHYHNEIKSVHVKKASFDFDDFQEFYIFFGGGLRVETSPSLSKSEDKLKSIIDSAIKFLGELIRYYGYRPLFNFNVMRAYRGRERRFVSINNESLHDYKFSAWQKFVFDALVKKLIRFADELSRVDVNRLRNFEGRVYLSVKGPIKFTCELRGSSVTGSKDTILNLWITIESNVFISRRNYINVEFRVTDKGFVFFQIRDLFFDPLFDYWDVDFRGFVNETVRTLRKYFVMLDFLFSKLLSALSSEVDGMLIHYREYGRDAYGNFVVRGEINDRSIRDLIDRFSKDQISSAVIIKGPKENEWSKYIVTLEYPRKSVPKVQVYREVFSFSGSMGEGSLIIYPEDGGVAFEGRIIGGSVNEPSLDLDSVVRSTMVALSDLEGLMKRLQNEQVVR